MKWGDLGSLFAGVASKRLTPHEVDPVVSNGHEFQGVARLRELLGSERKDFQTTYLLLSDEIEGIGSIRSWAKWYDSRENDRTRSAEWRLYYPAEAGQVQARMKAGDLMVIALTKSDELVVMLAPADSGRAAQLRLLFQIPNDAEQGMQIRRFIKPEALNFIAASILDELGFERTAVPEDSDTALIKVLADELTATYGDSLPRGDVVSALIRSRLHGVNAVEDPDATLTRWIEAEAAVFRAWEDAKIARRLVEGFVSIDGGPDVQEYRDFSMSLRQSRVSRAGGALEQHIEFILRTNNIAFDKQKSVDGGELPDFLFPGVKEYEAMDFPDTRLRMLAAKFTVKDRWRQVLNEAKRIKTKHLLTLEAAISGKQLQQMREAKLQLVIPSAVRELYGAPERSRIKTLAEFLIEVRSL